VASSPRPEGNSSQSRNEQFGLFRLNKKSGLKSGLTRDGDGFWEERKTQLLEVLLPGISGMKTHRWKRRTKPRTPVRLFLEQLEVRAMPTGLTVFGTDGAKHETVVKEENF